MTEKEKEQILFVIGKIEAQQKIIEPVVMDLKTRVEVVEKKGHENDLVLQRVSDWMDRTDKEKKESKKDYRWLIVTAMTAILFLYKTVEFFTA